MKARTSIDQKSVSLLDQVMSKGLWSIGEYLSPEECISFLKLFRQIYIENKSFIHYYIIYREAKIKAPSFKDKILPLQKTGKNDLKEEKHLFLNNRLESLKKRDKIAEKIHRKELRGKIKVITGETSEAALDKKLDALVNIINNHVLSITFRDQYYFKSQTTTFKTCFQLDCKNVAELRWESYRQMDWRSQIEVNLYFPEIRNSEDLKSLKYFIEQPDLRPAYASLHDSKEIRAYNPSTYGESFMMLHSEISKRFPKTYFSTTKQTLSPIILLNYLPRAVLSDYLGKPLEEYEFDSSRFEVYLPSSFKLTDPSIVRHVHFNTPNHFEWEVINELIRQQITVSIAKNPFDDHPFKEAFFNNTLEKFLLTKIKQYIYELALFIGETDEKHLILKEEDDVLHFIFKITPNQPFFHQAQAAAVLYLFGASFENNPLKIDFPVNDQKEFHYKISLNGQKRHHEKKDQEGLYDHDAYTNESQSLIHLLNKMIKRVFQVYILSQENYDHFLMKGVIDPKIGSGVTYDEKQRNELPLNLNARWFYDTVTLELDKNHVHALNIFKENSKIHQNRITIHLSISKILNILSEIRCNFYSTILYDDEMKFDSYGNIHLAWRLRVGGYCTSGGYSLNPYCPMMNPWLDDEFGLIDSKSGFDLIKQIGKSNNPSTSYHLIPASLIKTFHLDAQEFNPKSHIVIPIFQIANLSRAAVSSQASFLGISIEHYLEQFGPRLLLRDVNSIFVYLDYCQKELSKNKNCKVTIEQGYEKVEYKGQIFRLPQKDFGTIYLEGDEKRLSQIQSSLKENDIDTESELKGNTLMIKGVNPQQLLNIHLREKKHSLPSKNNFSELMRSIKNEISESDECKRLTDQFKYHLKELEQYRDDDKKQEVAAYSSSEDGKYNLLYDLCFLWKRMNVFDQKSQEYIERYFKIFVELFPHFLNLTAKEGFNVLTDDDVSTAAYSEYGFDHILFVAIGHQCCSIVEWLISHHPKLLKIKDSEQDTPFEFALKECVDSKIIENLINIVKPSCEVIKEYKSRFLIGQNLSLFVSSETKERNKQNRINIDRVCELIVAYKTTLKSAALASQHGLFSHCKKCRKRQTQMNQSSKNKKKSQRWKLSCSAGISVKLNQSNSKKILRLR